MRKTVITLCLLLCLFHSAFAFSDTIDKTIIIPHNQYALTPVLDIYIDDKGPFKFVIDTGASHSSISRDLADEIGLNYTKQNERSVLKAKDIAFNDITESVDLYISDQRVHRKTDLFVTDHKFNSLMKARGILGVAQFHNGVLENHPKKGYLQLILSEKAEECSALNEKLKCYKDISQSILNNFSLGSQKGILIVDTGNQASRSLVLFKSDYTNAIWKKHHHDLSEISINSVSNKPVKLLRTSNFYFDDKQCIGEVLLKNPEDNSLLLDTSIALIGWPLLEKLPFKIDYKTRKSRLNITKCPFDDVNTIGIKSIHTSADARFMYIGNLTKGSPADRVGVEIGDKVEKVIFSNGDTLTKFDEALYNYHNQHVYAPVGSQVTYFIRRDGELKPYTMTAEDVTLIEIE